LFYAWQRRILWTEELRAKVLVKTLMDAQIPKQVGVHTIKAFFDSGLAEAYGRAMGLKFKKPTESASSDGLRRASGPGSFEAAVRQAMEEKRDGRKAG
jgi:hypothetical protein